MAKSIQALPPITTPAEIGVPKVEVRQGVAYAAVKLPLGPLPGYIKRRVDIGRMSSQQSQSLASITSGLQFEEAKLADGTRVRTELHAIKWVLENLK